MIALPLFIPLSIYLNSINRIELNASNLQNMVRQVARAFVTSPTETLAELRAREVISIYETRNGGNGGSIIAGQRFELAIQCEAKPCLTPNAKVVVRISDLSTGQQATATQVVDAWRSSG